MDIDIARLRHDLISDAYALAFTGGFGGALLDANQIMHMSDEEVVELAESRGININNYRR